MEEKKLIYVASGRMSVKVLADGPIDAIKKALAISPDVVLDSEFIWLDERGARQDDTAQYKVPVEQALAEAGYVFDSEPEGGSGVSEPQAVTS